MKKLLFIFTTLLLFSCSSSSDDNNSSNSLFHPPTWIQGTWKEDLSLGYKFTSDNVCLVSLTTQFCFKEQIENTIRVGASASVKELINNSQEYKFSYTIESSTIYYDFIKNSESTIELESDSGYNSTFTKQ